MSATFYQLIEEATNALGEAMATARNQSTTPSITPPALLQVRAGRAESPGWFLAQAAEFAPEPLTVQYIRVRDIYASEAIVQALLEMMASEDWLDRRQPGMYHFAEEGQAIWQRSSERRKALLAIIEPRLSATATPLTALLDRIITASLHSSTPPGIWCLAHSRRRAPTQEAATLERLFQFFEDFNAFRDDAHMAAWQPHHISGGAWEAFAFVCGGEATTAADLFTRLHYRGYSRNDYAAFLADLEQRQWIAPSATPDAFQPTAIGQAVHAEAERLTDAYFYTPWAVLSASEIEQLRALLTAFCQQANDIAGN